MFDHLKYHDQTIKTRKIRKIVRGRQAPLILKIRDELEHQAALALEGSLIRQLGTIAKIPTVPHGPLTNLMLTDGIKGIMSQEARDKIGDVHRGKIITQETRDKIATTLRGVSARRWVIKFQSGEPALSIVNLKEWCRERGIKLTSLKNTLRPDYSYYRGMKVFRA